MKTTIYSVLLIVLVLFSTSFQVQAEETLAKQTFKKIATPESSKNWMHLKQPMKQVAFLQNLKTILDLDEGASFKMLTTESDELGWTHYKVQQYQHGIPIEGAQYILHEKDGLVQKANGKLVEVFCKNEQAAFSKEEAIQKVLAHANMKKYAWGDEDFKNLIKREKESEQKSLYPQPELIYFNTKFDDSASTFRLCYKIEIASIDPIEHFVYYINAISGVIENKISKNHNCFKGISKN